MLDRLIRGARLDKRLYTEVFFDNAATGDAVLLVAGIYSAIYLALALGDDRVSLSVVSLIGILLSGLIGWLIVSGGLWLAGTKLFEGTSRGSTVVRVTGFSHGPLALLVVAPFLPSGIAQLIVGLTLAWFVAALAAAAQVLFDFDLRKAVGSALLAVALWWVVQSIGIGDGLASLISFF